MVRSRNASRKRLNKRRITSRKSSRKSLRKKKNIRRKVLRNKRGGAYPDYVQTKIDEINKVKYPTLDSLCAILFGENYSITQDYYKTKDHKFYLTLNKGKQINYKGDVSGFNLPVDLHFLVHPGGIFYGKNVITINFRDNVPIEIIHDNRYLAQKRK